MLPVLSDAPAATTAAATTAAASSATAAAAVSTASDTKPKSPKCGVGSDDEGGVGGGAAAGGTGVTGFRREGAGAEESVLRWEAVDQLDPPAVERLLLRRAAATGDRGSCVGDSGISRV